MKALVVEPEAEADIRTAYSWYEDQRTGLGDDFLLCLEAALEHVQSHPRACASVAPDLRRALIRRFPYAVFFSESEDRLAVIAVFHASRDPAVWRSRRAARRRTGGR